MELAPSFKAWESDVSEVWARTRVVPRSSSALSRLLERRCDAEPRSSRVALASATASREDAIAIPASSRYRRGRSTAYWRLQSSCPGLRSLVCVSVVKERAAAPSRSETASLATRVNSFAICVSSSVAPVSVTFGAIRVRLLIHVIRDMCGIGVSVEHAGERCREVARYHECSIVCARAYAVERGLLIMHERQASWVVFRQGGPRTMEPALMFPMPGICAPSSSMTTATGMVEVLV